MRRILCILMAGILISCLPQTLEPVFTAKDLRPPAVTSWAPISSNKISIAFDELLSDKTSKFVLQDTDIESITLSDDKKSIIVEQAGEQVPGKSYTVSGIVEDLAGNMSSFILPYFGFNPNPPELVINEIITIHSKTRAEVIEFYVKKAGNCAGLAFFVGTPNNFDVKYIFPALLVESGDYIVLHMRPLDDDTSQIDELTDKAASGGQDASPLAWDLWFTGDKKGLPDKTGIITICQNPQADIMDAFVYCDKTEAIPTGVFSERLNSLGSAWPVSEPPKPTDCFYSKLATSTRSMCRSASSQDSNSASDWHIVPKDKASVGAQNKDDVYDPDAKPVAAPAKPTAKKPRKQAKP